MVSIITDARQTAQEAAKKAIESTYFGTMTVTEHQKRKEEDSQLTEWTEVVVLEHQPCKLSFERLQSAVSSGTAAKVSQAVKLFTSPEAVIRAGSKITVTQDNVTTDYTCSGIPAVYPTHQEIILELFERWA